MWVRAGEKERASVHVCACVRVCVCYLTVAAVVDGCQCAERVCGGAHAYSARVWLDSPLYFVPPRCMLRAPGNPCDRRVGNVPGGDVDRFKMFPDGNKLLI